MRIAWLDSFSHLTSTFLRRNQGQITEPRDVVKIGTKQSDCQLTGQDDYKPKLGCLDQLLTESLVLGKIVEVEEHELNPDQSESGPPKPSVSVFEGIVEAPSESWIGENDDACEFKQYNIGNYEGLDGSLGADIRGC